MSMCKDKKNKLIYIYILKFWVGSCRGENSITVNCKNCKIGGYHDSSFLTSGTRPAQVSGQLFAMCRKSSTFAAWFKLWVTLMIPSALSPKWVPSKSQVSPIFWRKRMGGRREGGGFRRIQLVSEGFSWFQKDSEGFRRHILQQRPMAY